MSWINRLLGSFRKNNLEDQLNDELQFHIEMRTQEFIAAGMDAEEARYRSHRLFGNQLFLKERTRDMDTVGWIETLGARPALRRRATKIDPMAALRHEQCRSALGRRLAMP